MQIAFDIPHAFTKGSDPTENARALHVLLKSLVSLNLAFLAFHKVPSLYQSGVVYDRTTVWDTIPALYARGYGDCKSLTAARVAELLHAGQYAQPAFRWFTNKTGQRDYHILVLTMNGWEDPSKALGMLDNENAPHFGNEQPILFEDVQDLGLLGPPGK